MTLIEHDSHFGRILEDLKRLEGEPSPERLTGYPEGYVEDTLHNLDILGRKGLLGELAFPGVPEQVPIGRLILANTMRCNLSCRYCYHRFTTAASAENDMTSAVFLECTRFLEDAGAELPCFELHFIGGEPLLHPAILEEASRWGELLRKRGKDLYIATTSNGTLLDGKMREFCGERQIRLKITLDGGREEHDCNRFFPGGAGSYDIIKANLVEFLPACPFHERYVATTIDSRACDPLERVLALASLGFTVIDLVELYSPGTGSSQAREEANEADFRAKYRRLLDHLFQKATEGEYLHVIPVFEKVRNLHLRIPAFLRCRAGGDSLAVSPDGTLYCCHHFFGDERFALGHVSEALSPGKLAPYRVPVTRRPGCLACWARLLCGGPCFHRSLVITGDPFRCADTECTRIQALLLEIMRFYLRLRNEGNQPLDWFLSMGMQRGAPL